MTEDDEPVDAIGPWTIKAVAKATRDAVTLAARKEGLTVGQWLERRVKEWTEDGGPVRVSHSQPASGQELALVSPPSSPGADRSELGALVRMARELSPPDKDTEVMRVARAAVRDRLRALQSDRVGNLG
jgi:hypothetical protein